MSLHDVATEGDRLSTLRALRDRLATQIDGTDSARDVSSLSQRLMDVLIQISDLEGESAQSEQGGTALDELNARRAARESRAARQA